MTGSVNDRIDRARLRVDPEYLIKTACEQFKQNDRYHRGLLTAQAFSRSLEDLGLRYGQKEVEDIMQFCTITDDGYVHYKNLLAHCSPEPPRACQTSMKSTIFPEEQDTYCASSFAGASCQGSAQATSVASSRQRRFLAERTDDIRQAYARWDRGLYTNEAFKTELRAFGLELTKELERLLDVHNRSRNMSFGQLMSALQIEEIDGRRARGQYLGSEVEASSGYNTVANREYQSVCSSSVTAATRDMQSPLRQAICDFVDGRIPAIVFRRQLRQGGVPVPPELDRLIRTHEQASSVTFQDFARAVLRQDREEHMNNGSATPSYMGSAPPTPSGADRNFAGGRQLSEPGSEQSGYQAGTSMRSGGRPPLRTPYASDDYPPPSQSGAASRSGPSTPGNVPVFRPSSDVGRTESRPESSSGVRRGGPRHTPTTGDFLRWDENRPSTGSTLRRGDQRSDRNADRSCAESVRSGARTPPQHRPGSAQCESSDMADCLAWPAAREKSGRGMEVARPGKRLGGYGERGAAQEILPWASADDDPDDRNGKHRYMDNLISAVPFGTDADMHHRRPDDAGTAEYLPQNQIDPRRRPF